MSETWLPVVGWEDLYEVSDLGRVRSLDRVVAFGQRERVAQGRVLKPGKDVHGVRYVQLTGDGRRKVCRVHLLVLEAFVGPRPEGMEGCHWDDDKENNCIANLRWDTHAANMQDAIRNGSRPSAKVPRRGGAGGVGNALKTHCPAGHGYTPENTKVGRNGGRWCRECHRIDGRERYQRDIENQRAYKREQQRRSRAKRKA